MNLELQRKKIIIITGASAGLGMEFARQIESEYYADEIWLLARREGPMRELAEGFRKMKAVTLPIDLTNLEELKRFEKKFKEADVEVVLLVNNAGFGKIGPFADVSLEDQINMIDLNCRTLVYLTGLVLPTMKKGSGIIQVASSIGFFPAPLFAVYAATKSFVVSFSEALHFELKDRGIRVTAVCPGPVATEFLTVAQKTDFMKEKVEKLESYNDRLMADAKSVVEKSLVDYSKGKRVSVYGAVIQLFVKIAPLLPRALFSPLIAKRNKVRA